MRRLILKKELYLPKDKLKIYYEPGLFVEGSVEELIKLHPDKLIKFLWNCGRKVRIDKRQFHLLLNELGKRYPELLIADQHKRGNAIKLKNLVQQVTI
jgi:hypothetical protein